MLLSSSLTVHHEAGIVLIDGWLQIRVPAVSAVLIKRLRQALEWVLEEAVGAAGGSGRKAGGGLVGKHAQAVMTVLQQLLAAEAKTAA
jgi:ATP-dependent RNA helicase DHX29